MTTEPLPEFDPTDPSIQFEVMDRASTIGIMLDTLLGEHPGLVNGKLAEKYEAAERALADFYEEAANILFEEEAQ